MKKFSYLLLILIMFILSIPGVRASTTGYAYCVENDDPLNIWSNTSRGSSLKQLACDQEMTILDTNVGGNVYCPQGWYKVSSGVTEGYVCSKYVYTKNNAGSKSPASDTNVGRSTTGDNIYVKENYNNPINGDGTISCYENTGDLSIKTAPGGGSSLGPVSCGTPVKINSVHEASGRCPYYYNITANGKTGYVCGFYVNTTKLSSTAQGYYDRNGGVDNYYKTLREKGFPDSYLPYLAEIHARHPNWVFNVENINIDFDEAVRNEAVNGRNLVQGAAFDANYYSMDLNTYNILSNTFYAYPNENGWYNASSEAIAFYMDPRNYLNVKYIFAFESLLFNEEHDANTISKILNQSYWPSVYSRFGGNVSTDVVNATREVGISSIHIASRIKQEISGISTSDPRLGGTFNYNGNNYSGYYNFFNIGVYGDNKIVNGMKYAMDNGWNTPYNGIKGGASFVYNDYVKLNQDTMYYEKFDVSTNDGNYTHQYMQNLAAAVQETNTTYNSYIDDLGDYVNRNHVFTIPVYKNMSNYVVTSPNLGNPNNYLNNLTINGMTVSGFSYDKYDYEVNLPAGTISIDVGASKIDGNASVSGTGKISIDNDDQDVKVVVTAQNGRTRTYTIKVKRVSGVDVALSTILNNTGVKYNDNYMYGINENTDVSSLINNVKKTSQYAGASIKDANGNIKNSGVFKTGDTVTINNSTESKTFTVLIYGDINGDGIIDKDDCLNILRHMKNYTNLSGVYYAASDVNKDGNIDKDDCLNILRHLKGYTNLNG